MNNATRSIEEIYRKHGPMVLRRCRALLGEDRLAEDAMHDVFVELMRRPEYVELPAHSSLLYKMATNTCLNRLRGQRRRGETANEELLLSIAAADDPARDGMARVWLDKAFGQHQESTRVMAVLHYVDGMTLEEVAAEVGMSVPGVRKRLARLKGIAQDVDKACKEREPS